MSMDQQSTLQGMGSPVSDEAFDILSALHNKLEALEAYEIYAEDGNPELWKQLSQQDQQAAMILVQQLEDMVRNGRFRAA